ncbi:TetR/AcrR family transcriptional regulator [Marilutibacter alkalisoli]|uniref:TetR/AcrR family transcriptional regulator n=1 Tax=Marilutibacter alkalisoli TaxID=2591633 RepID=A0A514BRW3_9GAMM|nr:TetR/AcrR family transcriptional regulator [Lysobacter alkalisoli]QDH70100.1 TetR/AcrR family transcriptional regulator [Lysobacter alkalisoli]
MNVLTATRKGSATREAIIDQAYAIACVGGMESLSIGTIAQAVGMSKSGVFAHFGSREDLQLAVLDDAGERFVNAVLLPALSAPRGLGRLQAIMEAWFDWVRQNEGGCLLVSAVSEYDDRPGPLRDRMIQHQQRWRQELARAIDLAIETGGLAPSTDRDQLAFELFCLALGVHHDAGLFGYTAAAARGRKGLTGLLASYALPAS